MLTPENRRLIEDRLGTAALIGEQFADFTLGEVAILMDAARADERRSPPPASRLMVKLTGAQREVHAEADNPTRAAAEAVRLILEAGELYAGAQLTVVEIGRIAPS